MTSKRRKTVLILLGVVAVTALIAVVGYLTREQVPRYNGKTLRQWLVVHANERYAKSKGEPAGSEGEQAIHQIGTNALPTLLLWIAAEPPGLKLPGKLGRFPPESFDAAEDRGSRANLALCGFLLLGEKAHPAIPELVGLLRKRHSVGNATMVLLLMGHDGTGVPALINYLADTTNPDRQWVLEIISYDPKIFGPAFTHDARLIKQCQACLADSDINVLGAAARALQQIAPETLTNTPPQ